MGYNYRYVMGVVLCIWKMSISEIKHATQCFCYIIMSVLVMVHSYCS